jgi:hypothetical protein
MESTKPTHLHLAAQETAHPDSQITSSLITAIASAAKERYREVMLVVIGMLNEYARHPGL